MTNSRKAAFCRRSWLLNVSRPAVEQDAHFLVIGRICTRLGLTPIVPAQRLTWARKRFFLRYSSRLSFSLPDRRANFIST